MKPSTKPVVRIVFLFLLMLLLSFACNLPGSQESSQTMALKEENGVVSGSLPYPEVEGDQKILFTVSEDGQATFRLDGAPESETLTVNLIDEQTAGLSWQGTTLDGAGELTGEEQAALDNLLADELGYGLAMIPLDAACRGEVELSPQQMAALLVPLQMQFKYAVPNRVEAAVDLMAASACGYGLQEENASDRASLIMFAPSMPVPVVFGYFPFDDVGAVEIDPSAREDPYSTCGQLSAPVMAALFSADDPAIKYSARIVDARVSGTGPCNAKCRGACGADCEPENCKVTAEHRCERDDQGRKTGYDQRILIYDCGMHEGCIAHDACYDNCNALFGCGSWAATACMHGAMPFGESVGPDSFLFCDQKAISEYGRSTATQWAWGKGPQPLRETFEYVDEDYGRQQNFRKCNVPDPTEPTGPNKNVPVGEYVGEVNVEGWFLAPERQPITEIIMNLVVFQVADDGTVSGNLNLIYDAEFTTKRENIVEITEVYEGTFSGQLTEPSGPVDIVLVNKTSMIGTDGSASGENTLPWVVDVQISGSTLTGSVGPFSGESYFTFVAKQK